MSELLCHLCGEGLLRPIGRSQWVQCESCYRPFSLDTIEDEKRKAEQLALTREAEQCFREDMARGDRTKRSSGSKGRKREKPPSGEGGADTAPPPWLTDERVLRVKRAERKMAISCRYSPALLDLFERLGFGREQRADAVRVAASELIWEESHQ